MNQLVCLLVHKSSSRGVRASNQNSPISSISEALDDCNHTRLHKRKTKHYCLVVVVCVCDSYTRNELNISEDQNFFFFFFSLFFPSPAHLKGKTKNAPTGFWFIVVLLPYMEDAAARAN